MHQLQPSPRQASAQGLANPGSLCDAAQATSNAPINSGGAPAAAPFLFALPGCTCSHCLVHKVLQHCKADADWDTAQCWHT